MVCRGRRQGRTAPVGIRQAGDARPVRSQRRGQHHTDILAEYEIHPGDLFFLPAGRVHSIGAGAFIAEIQQTSDITYRIYDFNRKDADGNTRELHTELAKGAIDYTVLPDYRTKYEQVQDRETELVSCPYFTTSLCDLTAPLTLDYAALDSFVVVICVEGKGMDRRRQRQRNADPSGRDGTASGYREVAPRRPRREAQNADQLHQVNGMHSDR